MIECGDLLQDRDVALLSVENVICLIFHKKISNSN